MSDVLSYSDMEMDEQNTHTAPLIELLNCPTSTIHKKTVITGRVVAEPGSKLRLWINQQEQKLMDNKWIATFTINSGNNIFEFMVIDENGQKTNISRNIYGGILPPSLEVADIPEITANAFVTLTGTVADRNSTRGDLPLLTINNRVITVLENGTWELHTRLTELQNEFVICARVQNQQTIMKKIVIYHKDVPEVVFKKFPSIVHSKNITISGMMSDLVETRALIKLNGKNLVPSKGLFSTDVLLRNVSNDITIAVEIDGQVIASVIKTIVVESSPPQVTLEEPQHIVDMKYKLGGLVSDEMDPEPKLTLNGKEVVYINGKWSKSMTMSYGENRIIVEVKNKSGKSTRIEKVFAIDIPVPTIMIGECPDYVFTNKFVLRGLVEDELKDTLFAFVNKNPVLLSDGRFKAVVELSEGENTIDVVVTSSNKRHSKKSIKIYHVPVQKMLGLESLADKTDTHNYLLQGEIRKDAPEELGTVNQLWINSKPVALKEHQWSYELTLNPGTNILLIEAQTDRGMRFELEQEISYDAG